jgi:hypothetical protein
MAMQIRAPLPFLVLLTACGLAAAAAEGNKLAQKTGSTDPGFERFKQLAGDWVGKITKGSHKDDKEIRVNYKVTSAGSAVVETLGAGTDHEMATVIHKDGEDLVLTHYCALGNQPRMKAERPADGNKIAFRFTGGSNMKSDKDMHMHAVTYTFVDKDNLKSEWVLYKDGKEAEIAVFELKRKK